MNAEPVDMSTIPKEGEPKTGTEPGISFEDLDNQWICPRCKSGKNKFQKYI